SPPPASPPWPTSATTSTPTTNPDRSRNPATTPTTNRTAHRRRHQLRRAPPPTAPAADHRPQRNKRSTIMTYGSHIETVGELIAALERYDPTTPVRIASQ